MTSRLSSVVLASQVVRALRSRGSLTKAALLQQYFKTGSGEYGEGDRFFGVMVPEVRRLARQFSKLSLSELQQLLDSDFNEARLLALLVLRERFRKADLKERKQIIRFYLRNLSRVNNWNLVDSSAPHLLGEFLVGSDRSKVFRLARSKNVWSRRVAVLTSFAWIQRLEFREALRLAEILRDDPHDLIHKATGWMLREIGKRDKSLLHRFLRKHAPGMPRTMLRYAIEKLPKTERARHMGR